MFWFQAPDMMIGGEKQPLENKTKGHLEAQVRVQTDCVYV